MLGLGIMRKCYGTSHPQVLAMVKNVKLLKMLKRAMVSNTGLPNASPVPASDLAARFGTLSFSPSAGGRVGKFGTVTEENIDIVSEHTSATAGKSTASPSRALFGCDQKKEGAFAWSFGTGKVPAWGFSTGGAAATGTSGSGEQAARSGSAQ